MTVCFKKTHTHTTNFLIFLLYKIEEKKKKKKKGGFTSQVPHPCEVPGFVVVVVFFFFLRFCCYTVYRLL
jgi:hypothetical protein